MLFQVEHLYVEDFSAGSCFSIWWPSSTWSLQVDRAEFFLQHVEDQNCCCCFETFEIFFFKSQIWIVLLFQFFLRSILRSVGGLLRSILRYWAHSCLDNCNLWSIFYVCDFLNYNGWLPFMGGVVVWIILERDPLASASSSYSRGYLVQPVWNFECDHLLIVSTALQNCVSSWIGLMSHQCTCSSLLTSESVVDSIYF